jgi:hypothetical protein
MAVIERDLDAVVTHLRWPSEHRKRIRTTDESVKARDSISGMCELFLGACGGGW